MHRILFFVLVFQAIGLASPVLLLAEEVLAIGRAKIFGKNVKMAEDQALKNAQRNAIEQAVGLKLDAKTVTENWQVIQDNVYTTSQGFITSYKVIKSVEDPTTQSWVVTIEATVSDEQLLSSLDALRLLHEKTGNQKYTLLYFQESERAYRPQEDVAIIAANKIKADMTSYGFRMVESTFNPDIPKLMVQLRQSGVEYAMLHEVVPNYPQSSGQFGLKPVAVSIRVTLYHVATREIIAVGEKSIRALTNATQGSLQWNQALNDSAGKTASALISELAETIAQHYRNQDVSGETFTVIFTDFTEDEELLFGNILRRLEGYKSLREIKKIPNLLSLEYRSLLSSDQLRSYLLNRALESNVGMETVSAESKRLVFKKSATPSSP